MYRFESKPFTLRFRFEAGTSRGVLNEKQGWLVRLSKHENPNIYGIGECSLIPGLSPDNPNELDRIMLQLNAEGLDIDHFNTHLANTYPALAFAVETALSDLTTGGQRLLYPSAFTEGQKGIPINGLIWMGNKDLMRARIRQKIEQGFDTIKIKVGALKFEDELELLADIRKHYHQTDLSIRLDANGAFTPDEAASKLEQLSAFGIHSVEQPIKPRQWEHMAILCRTSPIPIALDEELIGLKESQINALLDSLKPQFIILKPSLLGGFSRCMRWIAAAEDRRIGWWVTSALESNVGLNAISQWTATLNTNIPQGLGTGQLYHNNFDSPLIIRQSQLWYDPQLQWKITLFE